MDRDSKRILQGLVNQWDEVRAALQRMSSSAGVRPNDGWSIFEATMNASLNAVEFQLKPVVFNLPERADDMRTELYVVVQGRITIGRVPNDGNGALVTHGFSTEVAYFRHTRNRLSHVYGAHFDFALNELGHPVFHAQMKSFNEFAEFVRDQYDIAAETDDSVQGILKTVRLPSAQMDMFSFFVQICADHLLYNQSGPEERAAFNTLLQKNAFLQGTEFPTRRLGIEPATSCYRSRHWYPVVA